MVPPRNDSKDHGMMYNRGQLSQPNGYQREMLQDNWQQFASTFEEMKLKSEILWGIHALGY